ncbi:uncharacterized protein LOC121242225 [Juglans microcarpa x Juglans regia]|uniref:uncharacterized protein LOC121242225 n=1 Tax=Juglans microcarpa x Juglans regia TaxID=2249226 RepID=UPI001B7E6A24|nr:uncharacterized protein LOC121242225 [Juglans microcarpa x Juglans regia]
MEQVVTEDMNSTLSKHFTAEEIKASIFSMNPLGSPGSDGFPAKFFTEHWDTVGSRVYEAALEALNGCRLKAVLTEIISPTQTAFVLGRLITDNIIVAFESLHTMKARLKGNDGFMALKLDMSKAYDRIEPQSSTRFLPVDTKVALLIDHSTNQWNLPMLEAIFKCTEAGIIKSIPLSPFQKPDKLIWRCTPTGTFLVKNAYYLKEEMDKREVGQASELEKRKVTKDASRPICHLCPESIEHALWECSSAQDVWGQSSRKLQKTKLQSQTFKQLLESLFELLEDEVMIEFAIIAWMIWKRRNDLIFNNTFTHLNSLTQQAKVFIKELSQLQHATKFPTPDLGRSSQWEAPPRGKLKLNWDVALEKNNCKVGVGAVIRDWEGTVKATMRKKHDLYPDPLLAEAYALLQATIFCKSLGWKEIILEGDSLQVVNFLKTGEVNDSYVGTMIRDTKSILNSFTSWTVRHILRAGNVVAHVLSRDALSSRDSIWSVGTILTCIQTLL